MIRVLIVDDDKLVRLGLITAMPWGKHNMEVVGDVGSGQKAIEFIENNEVDFVLTDLEMPGMFGLELLKQLRARKSDLFCAVLTMHQEFDYIQEALRLGVLDYIIKADLGREEFDDVLGRLAQRIKNSEPATNPQTQDEAPTSEIHKCILRAVDIIKTEHNSHPTSTEMAKRVNMSRSYFCTCFKQIIGESYNSYFKTTRLERAKKLLKTTDKSVAWIAYETGYANDKYFSTIFKDYTGISPSEYRKEV